MSSGTRRILIVTVVVAMLALGLGGFYLYLTGANVAPGQAGGPKKSLGIVPVMSIYEFDNVAIQKPVGVASDSDGNIYATLRDGAPLLVFDANGKFVRKWGVRGYGAGQLMNPLGIAVDTKAGHVYVTDRGRLRLICYDMQGNLQWETPILGAVSVTVGHDGHLYVTTHGPIVVLDEQGQVLRQVGSRGQAKGSFDFAHQLVASPDDKTLFVADTNNNRVEAVRPSGNATAPVVWVVGKPPRYQDDPSTRFGLPSGITADSRGRLYVLDSFRASIELFDPKSGKNLHSWKDLSGSENGLFNLPSNIAYMGGDRFAITDTYNDRIQIVRLLPPGQNNMMTRNPWSLWLLPLLLIPLALLLRKRRVHVSREALDAARDTNEIRLLAGAFKKLYVLPEVLKEYENVEEEGVRVSDYLVATRRAEAEKVDSASSSEVASDEPQHSRESEEARLADSARQSQLQKILSVRNPVVCVDDDQARRLLDLGATSPSTLQSVRADYEIR